MSTRRRHQPWFGTRRRHPHADLPDCSKTYRGFRCVLKEGDGHTTHVATTPRGSLGWDEIEDNGDFYVSGEWFAGDDSPYF
jgi:hypothetical protein